MATPIKMPEAGESVVSGVLSSWIKGDGEWVDRDETVAEVETDKITVEIYAPAAGVLKHATEEGAEIEIGAEIGSIDESADKPAGATRDASSDASQAKSEGSSNGSGAAVAAPPAPPKPSTTDAPPSNGSARATPLARKLAEEHGLDLSSIRGTGVGDRINEHDVQAAIDAGGKSPAPAGAPPSPAPAPARTGDRSVTLERMTPLRQKVASRLVEAQQTAAMLTTFNECDMGAVMALRKQYKEAFAEKHGIGLGFMSFFVKAVCGALSKFPLVNSYIVAGDDGKPAIQKHSYCDVAIAVASPKGLVVPVIRSAETLSFAGIESAIKDFGGRAKAGKLELSEMQGGTFTITNGGVFGSLMSTPILNPPQSAILGMHAIKNRPMEYPAKSGQIAVRPMMYLALSYDHRIVDGAEAVSFLVAIKDAIEDPQRLMLDL